MRVKVLTTIIEIYDDEISFDEVTITMIQGVINSRLKDKVKIEIGLTQNLEIK